jgi:hypothetical protein
MIKTWSGVQDVPHRAPEDAPDRVLMHVGFGHSATTSLQTQFFSQRPDIFYFGNNDYRSAGGFFSHLKYLEDYLLDPEQMHALRRSEVCEHADRAGRPIVISDETFTEPTEVYYTARSLPGDCVAERLKEHFPNGRILFTIRSQFDYVRSMYFNLKRNYAFLAGMSISPFEEWWAGMQSQVRCWYLGNLDYAPLIQVYVRLFGRENVLVLPLEELKASGAKAYLESICEFAGLPLLPGDVERFATPKNARMTVVEERAAELLASRETAPILRTSLGNRALADLINNAPAADLQIDESICDAIRDRVSGGNRILADLFNLRLEAFGYPIAPPS